MKKKSPSHYLIEAGLLSRKFLFALPYGLDGDCCPPRQWDWANFDDWPERDFTAPLVRSFWSIIHE